MYIVTHTSPDWDAITGVWLLRAYGGHLGLVPVKFINTGNPDPAILEGALAVVDTGKEYEPTMLRFDHHQLPGDASNQTCATRQVWEYLKNEGQDVAHLKPLIDLIYCGDTGRKEAGADWSREIGIHALLSAYKLWHKEVKQVILSDEEILFWGFSILDMLDLRLRKQAEIRAELADKVVYKSADGLVWGIRYGSTGSTFAAFELGARLVVFEGEPLEVEGGTTYPIGVMRAGEWNEPHTGKLVKYILDRPIGPDYKEELATWFLHGSGFFSGRGTAKAPVFKPVEISLTTLASYIDIAWER